MTLCTSPFFIVCSASTGSTLLSAVLDRHPLLAIGPELYLFNKDRLYYPGFESLQQNFSSYLKNGILSAGEDRVRTFFFNKQAYFVTDEILLSILACSGSLREFIDQLFDAYLEKRGKRIWGEKTGNNALFLHEILNLYPDAKIIHLVRNPMDVIASMKRRGVKSFDAVGHWLFNNAAALRFKGHEDYLLIKYEDMVADPQIEFAKICTYLGVDFDDRMLEPGGNEEYWRNYDRGNIHATWGSTPFATINTNSIGKGCLELDSHDQLVLQNLRLSSFSKRLLNIPEDRDIDCQGIAAECGYSLKQEGRGRKSALVADVARDYMGRLYEWMLVNKSFSRPLFKGRF